MPTPTCPRCGYDLSGPVATWDEAGHCPLQGTCSECGLVFRWFDVFNRDNWRLDGFVEHARGLGRSVRWAWRTTWWTLWPWNFWGRVEMHHKVRPWMWLWWFLLMISLPRALTQCLFIAETYHLSLIYSWQGFTMPSWRELFFPLFGLDSVATWNSQTSFALMPGVAISRTNAFVIVAIMAWASSLVLLPFSLTISRVRFALIARATVFSLVLIAFQSWLSLIGHAVTATMRIAHGAALNYYNPSAPATASLTLYRGALELSSLAEDHAGPYLIWLSLWWLAAYTRGFRLRRGWLAWLAILTLVHVTIAVWLGAELNIFGRYYRL